MRNNEIFRGCAYYYEKVKGITFNEEEIYFLGLNTPPMCNYNCDLCLASCTTKSNNFGRKLTIKEYIKIITDAYELGVKHIELSGEGEPFLYYPEVRGIIEHATRLGIHTLIHTNGSLLTKEIIDFLSKMNVSIMISLSYIDENKFNKFTGTKDQLEKVIKNIQLLSERMKNKVISKKGYFVYRVGINSEQLEDNNLDLEEIGNMCKQYNLFANVASVIGGQNLNINKVMDRRENSIIVCKSATNHLGQSVCALFHYGIGIRCDGEVLFETHSYNTTKIIGNVRNLDLDKLIKRNKDLQRIYFNLFNDNGFCPLRNSRFNEFTEMIKNEKYKL